MDKLPCDIEKTCFSIESLVSSANNVTSANSVNRANSVTSTINATLADSVNLEISAVNSAKGANSSINITSANRINSGKSVTSCSSTTTVTSMGVQSLGISSLITSGINFTFSAEPYTKINTSSEIKTAESASFSTCNNYSLSSNYTTNCLVKSSKTNESTNLNSGKTIRLSGIDDYVHTGVNSVTTIARTSAADTTSTSYSSSYGISRPSTEHRRLDLSSPIATFPTSASSTIPRQTVLPITSSRQPLLHTSSPRQPSPRQPSNITSTLQALLQSPLGRDNTNQTHREQFASPELQHNRQQQLLHQPHPIRQQVIGNVRSPAGAPHRRLSLQEQISSPEHSVSPNPQHQIIKQLLLRNTLLTQLAKQRSQTQTSVLQTVSTENSNKTRRTVPRILSQRQPSIEQRQRSSLQEVVKQAPVVPEPSAPGHMTCGGVEAIEGLISTPDKMDNRLPTSGDISPYIINTCCDLTYSTDFVDTSIYASSPNSLFIYEQEKVDMQGTISSPCTTVEPFADDFELKSQYEMSKDISNSLPVYTSSSFNQNVVSSMMCERGSEVWGSRNTKPTVKDKILLKPDVTDEDADPTLAELNLDLLDDIETYINVEMNSPCMSMLVSPGSQIKQDTTSTAGQYGGDKDIKPNTGQGHSVGVTQYQDNIVIKTEPVDSESTSAPTYNTTKPTSFLTLQPIDSKIKLESPTPPQHRLSQHSLHTIKEIDISDTATLQQLLMSRPGTIKPRTRAVSESTAIKSPARKRTYNVAGLESMDRKWKEIKEFIYTSPPHMEQTMGQLYAPPTVKRERKRYDSASSAVTLTSNEDEDSDSDRDFDEDSDSDLEGGHDIGSLSTSESLIGGKEKTHFWQYNIQSKGPKGTRVQFDLEEDPHVFHDFEDPVFDPTNSRLPGIGVSIKHGGKARKGDGNDIVPSPKKLCQIGLSLRKISRQINDFVPVSELPSSARGKTRKEKNKLASRACRLKKKAQHEANKIKLHGLELEHRQLLTVIRKVRQKLVSKLQSQDEGEAMTSTLEGLIKEHLEVMIGGNTTDFVNRVVRRVEEGDVTGGIRIQATRSYPKELHN